MGISDVLVRHEAYTGIPSAASVHSFPHIIFEQSNVKVQMSREETAHLTDRKLSI